MLKIYGRANSINVRKALWVADEIGLTYDREDWGRGYRPTTDPEYKRVNPFEVVPTIDDDGYILRESSTIVRYLATKHGREDLFPTSMQDRFSIEAWMDWGSNDLYDFARPVVHGLVFKTPGFEDPKLIRQGAENWAKRMRMLEDYLANHGPFLMGDTFTIADIPAGLVVNRWYAIDFEKPDFPATKAYYDRLAERPAYRTHGRNGTP
ncbi:MAG TPA: glutathione S-transferase family protein [Hyphomicrobiaceae bacterium]|nr:glutathione S-transferase family protein [Hyphomicrobiaceae bacterium]